MSNKSQSSDTVGAVERAVGVVEALKQLDGAGVTELSDHLGMSKSGVYKQLSTLVEAGIVTKQGTEYRLSFRLLSLGEYVRTNSRLYNVAAEEIDKLAEKNDHFAYLTVMDAKDCYCIHTAKGKNAVVPNLGVGNRIPFHHSAAGKAILSHLPKDRWEELMPTELTQMTEQTITDPETLKQELATVREEGVAFERGESVPGMRGVGAPIVAEDQTVVGAVAISGPVSLLQDMHFTEKIPSMILQTKNFIEVKFSLESRDPLREGSHIPENFY